MWSQFPINLKLLFSYRYIYKNNKRMNKLTMPMIITLVLCIQIEQIVLTYILITSIDIYCCVRLRYDSIINNSQQGLGEMKQKGIILIMCLL